MADQAESNPSLSLTFQVLISCLSISGITHGIFEVLQGNTSTSIGIIAAIGPDYQTWEGGSEEAFTIIPNFLITGLLAIGINLLIIYVVISKLDAERSFQIILGLEITAFLLGSGIGFVVILFFVMIYGRKSKSDLSNWKDRFQSRANLQRVLAKFWSWFLIIAAACFLIALYISVFSIFGLNTEELFLIIFGLLGLGIVFINITFIAAIARDIGDQL